MSVLTVRRSPNCGVNRNLNKICSHEMKLNCMYMYMYLYDEWLILKTIKRFAYVKEEILFERKVISESVENDV